MPEFFSFTLGAETNPRIRSAETSPLLVGRFRAFVPANGEAAAGGGGASGRQAGRGATAAAGYYGAIPPGMYQGYDEYEDDDDEDDDDDDYDHDGIYDDHDDDAGESDAGGSDEAGGAGRYSADEVMGSTAAAGKTSDTAAAFPLLRMWRWRRWPRPLADEAASGHRQHRHGRLRRNLRRPCRRLAGKSLRNGRQWLQRRLRQTRRHLCNLWLTPKHATVRRAVDHWWSRWALLVALPAVVAVAWCAVPMPQYPLAEDGDDGPGSVPGAGHRHRTGHGEARVRINMWFFLLAYYGPYNVTALVWITKVFNLYSLNWWPPSLGFPLSVSLLAAFSLAVPAALCLVATATPAGPAEGSMAMAASTFQSFAAWLVTHNTAWVSWTFAVMATPVAAALLLLLLHERHLGLRHPLSETQRIFLPAPWTSEEPEAASAAAATPTPSLALAEAPSLAPGRTPSPSLFAGRRLAFPPLPTLASRTRPLLLRRRPSARTLMAAAAAARRQWLPASFVRFLWLMSALFTSLLVFEMGEASASLFLSALPQMQHETVYAVIYVWGWTVTVFLLDALTGWILGGHQGERVGSYPLGWVFKLYFMLTYQTYVRALYARLRKPSQFVLLQVLSSSSLVVLTPLLMAPTTHRVLAALGINGQTYGAFQKVCVRNVYVRFLAENSSMLAFLGSLMVLHFGANREVYPYFAFDGGGGGYSGAAYGAYNASYGGGSTAGFGYGGTPAPSLPPADTDDYTFSFTLYAASITWACELVAAFVVDGLIRYFYGLSVVAEAKSDLAVWPELLPTSVAVAVHVLQNMLFSIVRIRF